MSDCVCVCARVCVCESVCVRHRARARAFRRASSRAGRCSCGRASMQHVCVGLCRWAGGHSNVSRAGREQANCMGEDALWGWVGGLLRTIRASAIIRSPRLQRACLNLPQSEPVCLNLPASLPACPCLLACLPAPGRYDDACLNLQPLAFVLRGGPRLHPATPRLCQTSPPQQPHPRPTTSWHDSPGARGSL